MAYKQNVIEGNDDAETPASAWLLGLAAWAVPGAGHLLQGKWLRGLLMGGAVWSMFIIGFVFGGHLFAPVGKEHGMAGLMQLPPMIADLGTGLLYILCWAGGLGFTENARLVTYEYGNTFLMVAGLMNYLVMLDAFDIAVRRKA